MLVPDGVPLDWADDVAAESTMRVRVEEVELTVSAPEWTLVSLTLGDVREHRDLALVWLRSLVVAQPALEAAYGANPRHVLMARMGHLARDLGNERLADQIERCFRHTTGTTRAGRIRASGRTSWFRPA